MSPYSTMQNNLAILKQKKLPWNQVDDFRLRQVIERDGLIGWSKIADRVTGRTSKQCRERWINHLNPDIKNGDWSNEEDEAIVQLQRRYGNKWALIATMIPKRTDNAIKNRFHYLRRSKSRSSSQSSQKISGSVSEKSSNSNDSYVTNIIRDKTILYRKLIILKFFT